ncbi:ABC transporter permease subunit [bacterium]|nr:ABC transporter permease subunit [bacterium]
MATTAELPRAETTESVSFQDRLQALYHSYLLRKTLKALFTIWLVITLTFFLIRLLPGNPVELYMNQLIVQYSMPLDEARDQASALFNIDLEQPVLLQYAQYMSKLVRGDLGMSILSPGATVAEIIARHLPWTMFSVGLSLIISFLLGVTLGILMAYRRNSLLDHSLTFFASVFSSLPNYLVGILIIVWFGVQLKILPIAEMRGSLSPGMRPGLNWEFVKDALFHASLPMFTYILTTIGGWMLAMKSNTLSTLEEDYVTVARARGLKDSRITTAYVGRNASLPLFTTLAISIGFVVGGSILIETIFRYEGIGLKLLESIQRRDYTLMQGIFLIITISVVAANYFADILYSVIDPRIKLGEHD